MILFPAFLADGGVRAPSLARLLAGRDRRCRRHDEIPNPANPGFLPAEAKLSEILARNPKPKTRELRLCISASLRQKNQKPETRNQEPDPALPRREESREQAAGELVVDRKKGEAGKTAATGFGDLCGGGRGLELALVRAGAEPGHEFVRGRGGEA